MAQLLSNFGADLTGLRQGASCAAREKTPFFLQPIRVCRHALEAVAAHTTRLGEKLRREGLGTDHVHVFFHTSEHDWHRPQHAAAVTVRLPEATSDTLALIAAAKHG